MLALPKILTPDNMDFPPITEALTDPNGLLAIGGTLSTDRLIDAYQRGIFPWFNPGEPVLWWSPDPRAVLFPQHLKISRSLRKILKKSAFQVTHDQNFLQVIKACAQLKRKNQGGTWISHEMINVYTKLHQQGYGHSIEVYLDTKLVGGLYGIVTGQVFSGESMFNTVDNAAKIALSYLAENLQKFGCDIIDCQILNPFLASLGAITIPRQEFVKYLLKS